jgi:hypothetical protein
MAVELLKLPTAAVFLIFVLGVFWGAGSEVVLMFI